MAKTLRDLPPHPVRAILPPLEVLRDKGYDSQQLLRGTGITQAMLADGSARMSLQQELTFYRNVLELTGDPVIGLKLGEPFIPQRYGLFGYALLSAPTFRHALAVTENFGRLTFSFYSFQFGVEGSRAWFSMSDPPPIEERLVDLYLDRDMSAATVDFSTVLGTRFPLFEVHLTHDGHGKREVYRQHFGCEVLFEAPVARFVFSSELLDQPLPQGDPESSRHLLQQCQMLIAKLSAHGHFIDDVRMLVLARPGIFPDIEYVADKLGMSTRTLRRRLKGEGSSYRELLDEIRYGLAREYLANTQLPMDEVSRLLGYTESGNFSHAFRRWSGMSPTAWRRDNPPL